MEEAAAAAAGAWAAAAWAAAAAGAAWSNHTVKQSNGHERVRGSTGIWERLLCEGHSGAEPGRKEGKRHRTMGAAM